MANNNKEVPPIPYKTPVTDANGFMSMIWATWFRQVLTRIGGSNALTNLELANVQTAGLDSLSNQVTLLQARVSTLENVQAGLGVGPVL